MTPDDFDKLLNTEPHSRAPEFLAAKRGDLGLARRAAQAEAFEEKLKRALRVPVDETAADRIMAAIEDRPQAWRSWSVSLAVAATIVVAVAFAVLLPRTPVNGSDPMVAAFYDHMTHEEPGALASATPVAAAQASLALEQLGAGSVDDALVVTYVYPCPIDGRAGLHLVLTDAEAHRATVLFSPGGRVAGMTDAVAPDGSPARAFNIDDGSIYVVAHDAQPVDVVIESLFGNGGNFLAGSL